MASWRRVTGAAGVIAGATAAGAGAIVTAERIAVARIRGRSDPESTEPFGRLRGRPLTVLTEDGVALHVELNGPSAAPVTVVFCHGYTLNQDCWHFQRRDLAGHRLAFWDQRDHGRSGRAEPGAAGRAQRRCQGETCHPGGTWPPLDRSGVPGHPVPRVRGRRGQPGGD